MSRFLRRFATLLLLLTVPLRVYAAAAMVFCGPEDELPDVESTVSIHHHLPATMVHGHVDGLFDDGAAGALQALQSSSDSHHTNAHDAVPAHDHFSCAACCCAGMISTAGLGWKPQSFPTPATPSFVAIAVPSTVPQRLDRPPKAVLA